MAQATTDERRKALPWTNDQLAHELAQLLTFLILDIPINATYTTLSAYGVCITRSFADEEELVVLP